MTEYFTRHNNPGSGSSNGVASPFGTMTEVASPALIMVSPLFYDPDVRFLHFITLDTLLWCHLCLIHGSEFVS